MGKTLVSLPARAEALLLALIPLAGGAFLLFLGTPADVRFGKLFQKMFREEDQ
jgi:hypothetical protein